MLTDPLVINIQKSKLKYYGDKAFSVIAPREWNELSPNVGASKYVTQFKTLLKTQLFRKKEGAGQLSLKALQNIV